MYIVPSLIVVVVVLFLIAIGLLVFAGRRGWTHWARCTPANLALSYVASPTVLLVYRLGIFTYCCSILIWLLARKEGEKGLLFYTVWNFTFLTVFFLLASVQSVSARMVGYDVSRNPSTRLLDRTTLIMFEIAMTIVFLVDVVLWGVLYPQAKHVAHRDDNPDACCQKFLNFGSYNVHGFNMIFMLGELFLNRIPIIPAHVSFVIFWMLTYGIYSWIIRASGGRWVYFFLDTTKQDAPGWYLGMAALHIVFFFFAFGLTKLKTRCFRNARDTEAEEIEATYLLSTNSSIA